MTATGTRRDSKECKEKQDLLAQLRDAFQLLNSIDEDEIAAASQGDRAAHVTYAGNRQALERHKNQLVQRLGEHVANHGC